MVRNLFLVNVQLLLDTLMFGGFTFSCMLTLEAHFFSID